MQRSCVVALYAVRWSSLLRSSFFYSAVAFLAGVPTAPPVPTCVASTRVGESVGVTEELVRRRSCEALILLKCVKRNEARPVHSGRSLLPPNTTSRANANPRISMH